ncbi:uncharacterized protein B0P05DRAFT_564726 [Gilbertella persicaria]|uniref:uncharacterized protein n=1 Tax=Gilbertella persicaria TaxID=101096 RepID=UPI00221EB18A|nr:uncharacterized protein B0P05DRAFT_564726 [Gilbertella persicaria]KAI8048159.1 hypothetical protein B0P05DRAFT_564726 [Gilbertella persicaria]
MSHIPKKAFVFYCPIEPDQPIPNVDSITLLGCSGQIALEKTSNNDMLQLLGVHDMDTDIQCSFKQRFNDMSLHIFSNSSTTKALSKQLGCTCQPIESIDQIKQQDSHIIFVDFTDDTQHAWQFIDQLSDQPSANTIYCIISPSNVIPDQQKHWWDTLVPRQSHVMKHGSIVEIQDRKCVYSYLHTGSCRKDNTTKYTSSDIIQNGSNNTILAWHLMAEIGHKLGFVEKYGA